MSTGMPATATSPSTRINSARTMTAYTLPSAALTIPMFGHRGELWPGGDVGRSESRGTDVYHANSHIRRCHCFLTIAVQLPAVDGTPSCELTWSSPVDVGVASG